MDLRSSRWLLAFVLLWHVLAVFADAWPEVDGKAGASGRDFASYYYAARVADEGGDPYDKVALGEAARLDGTRATVHPFFYPPPFLLLVSWTTNWPLHQAYQLWFWIDEAALIVVAWALVVWSSRLGPAAPVAVLVIIAALSAIPNNHVMGQANLIPLAAAMLGVVAVQRDRPLLGGSLVGLACMLKMSPALIVLWWMLHRRWTPVVASVVAGIVLSVAATAVLTPAAQLHFYATVLPAFGSGDYNGLTVPIGMFGNHSLPNLLHQAFPAEEGLSATARMGSGLLVIGAIGGLASTFVSRGRDALSEAGQVGATCVAMLLLPVYTYEHHLVWTLPSMVAAVAGIASGRLGAPWALAVGGAIAVLGYDLASLKNAAEETWQISGALQEIKTAGIVVIGAANVSLGRSA